MTLREQAAIAAMQAMVSEGGWSDIDLKDTAERAVHMADLLVKEFGLSNCCCDDPTPDCVAVFCRKCGKHYKQQAAPMKSPDRCEHKRISKTELPYCLDCGVGV